MRDCVFMLALCAYKKPFFLINFNLLYKIRILTAWCISSSWAKPSFQPQNISIYAFKMLSHFLAGPNFFHEHSKQLWNKWICSLFLIYIDLWRLFLCVSSFKPPTACKNQKRLSLLAKKAWSQTITNRRFPVLTQGLKKGDFEQGRQGAALFNFWRSIGTKGVCTSIFKLD